MKKTADKNLEDETVLYEDRKHQIPFYTPFIEQKQDIDHSSALYSIKVPFKLLHADVAKIHFFFFFFSKSAADPHLVLLIVDSFTSKIYTYPMKKRTLLLKKFEIFYKDTEQK